MEKSPKNDVFNYTRQEFVEMFSQLTGESNMNDMVATFRGFHLFAWIPMFWPQIYNFPIQPEDVIVATFPKSGTTWMQHMVHLILTEDFEAARTIPVDVRAPFIDLPRQPYPWALEKLADQPAPRILKTHLPANLLPKDAPNGRVICVYRNAKDVAVSFFHHYIEHQPPGVPFPKDFDGFARDFIAGKVLFGPYPEHLKGYLEYQQAGNSILMLRYEDIKTDARQVIRKIASYLGKVLSDETVDRIYEATTVESMRENTATNFDNSEKDKTSRKVIQSIRKGIVGDWKNHFDDPKLVADFEAFIKQNLPKELISPDTSK